jgi:hypothetical protein
VSLSRGHWVTIGVTLGAVILTAVFHICIREWYQPDIRYEEGSWYRSTGSAIGSLKLHNAGHSDAEDVQVIASFSEPITDIAVSDPGIIFRVISGGVDKKEVCGIISRIVPDETIYVYFVTKNPSLLRLSSPFISHIKFKGGKGKTGKPYSLLMLILGGIVGAVVGTSMVVISYFFIMRQESKGLTIFYENLSNSISLGITSARENLSEEQLKEKFEREFGKVIFLKPTLFDQAMSIYKIVKDIKSK